MIVLLEANSSHNPQLNIYYESICEYEDMEQNLLLRLVSNALKYHRLNLLNLLVMLDTGILESSALK